MSSFQPRVVAALVVSLVVIACASATSEAPSTAPPSPSRSPASSAPAITSPPTSPPAAVTPVIDRIAAGSQHTCALSREGGVKCWGSNGSGQLGNGTTTDSSTPVDVAGLASGFSTITAGGSHTCALTSRGGVKCWGSNGAGQLGNGSTTDSSVPVDVSGLEHGVIAVAAGGWHTCAVMGGGGLTCWGSNEWQQLGTGTSTDSSVPVNVSGLGIGIAAIAAGALHSCALTTGGGVKCWGYGGAGPGSVPVDVSGLESEVSMIAPSYDHTCVLTTSGAVKCWAANYNGQLGDGTNTASNVPVDVSGLGSEITAISAGFGQTCALASSGRVTCWGVNDSGNASIEVAGIASGVIAIAAGGGHACALTSTGAVTCWGDNWEGQLGNGRTCSTLSSSSTPVDVDFTTPSTSEPTSMPVGPLEHATGPTDVVLRIDYGPDLAVGELEGDVFMPGPEFTLYGDGTVIFGGDLANLLPAEDPIVRAAPFMIGQLDEDQVQSLLRFALGEGGLADACEVYPTNDIDGFGGPVFTIRAGGLEKRVEVDGPSPLGQLTEQISGFVSGTGVQTRVWVPDRFWGILNDAASNIEIGLLPDPREAGSAPWPWPGIAPEEFSGRRVMSPAEAAVLGLSNHGGVVRRVYLIGPDGTTIYSFSMWPMAPDETG
jgi:alpha-tubulin suppressor-like RCC1 family protein